jgi:parallel beta-helix repeat protein
MSMTLKSPLWLKYAARLFLAVLVFAGCDNIIDAPPLITLDQNNLTVNLGDTATLNVTAAEGITALNWTSSDNGIAKVSGNVHYATVTPVSAGTAVITASVDNMVKVSATVTVQPVSGPGVYYIAPNGSDTDGDGTIDKPWFTFGKADSAVSPGSTVYIRGGIYRYTEEDAYVDDSGNKGGSHSTWFRMFNMDKSGGSATAGHTKYFAYPGDPRPVIDMSQVIPENETPSTSNSSPYMRVQVFYVTGSYFHFKGFDIIGTQVRILSHTQSECIRNEGSPTANPPKGSYNIYENLAFHDGKAIGFYLQNGKNNLVLNCDAYNNWDNVSEGGSGENVDGFGAHGQLGSTGNKYIGCRAWANSDDGFDCISNWEAVLWDNCWSFYNGYSQEPDGSFVKRGNGQGFKAGGWDMSPGEDETKFPVVTPRHTVQYCISANNGTNGFDANFQIGTGANWYHNTAYNNPTNFNMQSRGEHIMADIWSVPGYGARLINNLSFKSGIADIANINTARSAVYHNSWQMDLGLTDGDFLSLDVNELIRPRNADGSLPDVSFMRPSLGSNIIDQGVRITETTTDQIDPLSSAEYAGQKAAGINYTMPMVIPPDAAISWNGDTTPYHPVRGAAPDIGALEY